MPANQSLIASHVSDSHSLTAVNLSLIPSNSPDVTQKLMDRIMGKIDNNLEDLLLYDEYDVEDMDILILSYGGACRSALSAQRELKKRGHKVGVFKAKTLWPFPEERIKALTKQVNKVLVVEMNGGQYYYEVDRVAHHQCEVSLLGKINGETITPNEVMDKIEEVL